MAIFWWNRSPFLSGTRILEKVRYGFQTHIHEENGLVRTNGSPVSKVFVDLRCR